MIDLMRIQCPIRLRNKMVVYFMSVWQIKANKIIVREYIIKRENCKRV